MGDEKLKQELFYMVKLSTKYDFSDMSVVEGILRLENERKILNSVFGARFKKRIFDIATDTVDSESCVICGNPAENKVICKHCIDQVLESNYAKEHEKPAEKSKSKKLSIKFIAQIAGIVLLSLLMVAQLTVLITWFSFPGYNKSRGAYVSGLDTERVTDAESALQQVKYDFDEAKGYRVTFVREDQEIVGRFLLSKGECCEEVEEQLTDEEKYDYFFKEPVYVFYVTKIDEYDAMAGIVEVSESGDMLISGSFNDGRNPSYHYKLR